LYLSVYYPAAASLQATDPGQFSLSVTIPAGQRISKPFYLQGQQTGSAQIAYYGGGYPTFNTYGTVTQTAFVFREQSPSVNVNATGTLTVLPALSPLGTQGLGPLSIRGGATPITITVTSSDTKVLSVTTPQVTLRPGDQQATVTVRGVSAGVATLTLSGQTYDFTTAQSSVRVTVK
jgi:hypothetical protein